MRLMPVALVLAFAGGSAVAFAAEKTISQKGRAFSEAAVTIKKGETLVFVNDDNIAHNIMSTTTGNEFHLGSQAPDASSNVTLVIVGEVSVLRAIHPRMNMSLTLSE